MDNTLTTEKVFAGRLLRVPDYQRGYAWDPKQWNDFLEDLDLLPAGKQHFTGTLVLDRMTKAAPGAAAQPDAWDIDGGSYEQFNIVDGQQRLTTIVLLLDAIRRELARGDFTSLADGIGRTYVSTVDTVGQPLVKLALNSDTNDFWVSNVLADRPGPSAPTNAAQKRLEQARQYFAKYLSDRRGSPDYYDWLKGLRAKITSNLMFVPYEVSSSAEVGVIFEVMNDRGKQLTELEKAKNYLLYLSTRLELPHTSLEEQVNVNWARIFQRLMSADLSDPANEDQLMRAHWLMEYNPDRRSWRGAASLKRDLLSLRKHVGDHVVLLDKAQSYAKSLEDAAIVYAELYSPKLPGAFATMARTEPERLQIVDAARRLLRLRAVATFLPLLMAIRLRYPDDGRHYVAVLDLCERFGFRVYRLLGKYANSGQSSFFRLAHEVAEENMDQEATLAAIEGLINYYSPGAEVGAALSADRKRPWYPWYGLKYFLYEWEAHLAGNKGPQIAWEQVEQRDLAKSIEHILPQTPTNPYWQKRFSIAQQRRLTHDIGNLVLTEDNSSYGNKSFPDKRGTVGARDDAGKMTRSYANSVLFQERALAPLDHWTPATVMSRRDEILAWAQRRWYVVEAATPTIVKPDDDERDSQDEAESVA